MMHITRWIVAVVALAGLVAAGCWYQQPKLDEMYGKTSVGMSRDDVIKVLGQPSGVLGNELFYLYDDPEAPARFRFVLNEKGFVVEKYLETKKELAKKAEETMGVVPPVERLPGEEGRTYPGGPLPRFETKPGMPERLK
ncbi:MAG: hypothetical protein NTU94_10280 [Planctomycetota bacterium]|nr:hypothetical protein [Planctomycetota bacterium]